MFFRDEDVSGFPRGHLKLAFLLAIISSAPLLLWPSKEISANRVTVPIAVGEYATALEREVVFAPSLASAAGYTPARASMVPVTVAAPAVQKKTDTVSTPSLSASTKGAGGPWKQATVQSGDSLSVIFGRLGLSPADVHEVTQSGKEARQLRHLRPGEKLSVRVASDGSLEELRYKRSLLEALHVTRRDGELIPVHEVRKPEVRKSYSTGTIDSSLFLDAKAAGLSDRKIMELAGIFGWDIDFALDLREGDAFGVLYEEKFLDGKQIGEGNILAAFFTNQGRKFNAVRYEGRNGVADYFAPNGDSMRKAFLRTPVEFARISSHFNLRRKHPILHTIRAHKGVDYAAARGTPIRAAGDGKVSFAGRKGGYGKVVILQHGEKYSTLYAHMKGFRKGVRRGAKVRQGQIIGYVGSTGLASGPHLHYEFRVNGVHRNPVTVKLPKSTPVPKSEYAHFVASTRDLMAQIEDLRSNPLALNDP